MIRVKMTIQILALVVASGSAWSATLPPKTCASLQSGLISNVSDVQRMQQQTGIGQVVLSVSNSMTQLNREVVTRIQKQDEAERANFSASILKIFGLSAGYKHDHHEQLNTTKILTLNPKEVAGNDARKAAQFSKLQQDLKTYVANHARELIDMKQAATLAFLQIGEIRSNQDSNCEAPAFNIQQIDSLYRTVSEMNFYGQQTSLFCTDTKHDGYQDYVKDDQSAAANLNLMGLIKIGASGSASSQNTDTHPAYREVTCAKPEVRVATQGFNGDGMSVDLNRVDENLRRSLQWAAALTLKQVEAPPYFTGNNPYYTNDKGDGLGFIHP